jgi:hypothetical protein
MPGTRSAASTPDGVVTELVDGVNKLGLLVELADGGAWVEVG